MHLVFAISLDSRKLPPRSASINNTSKNVEHGVSAEIFLFFTVKPLHECMRGCSMQRRNINFFIKKKKDSNSIRSLLRTIICKVKLDCFFCNYLLLDIYLNLIYVNLSDLSC